MIIAQEILFRNDYKSLLVIDIAQKQHVLDDIKMETENCVYQFTHKQNYLSKNFCLKMGSGNINGAPYLLYHEIMGARLFILEPADAEVRFQKIKL